MIGNWLNSVFQSIMLWIDSVIYWFASQCYQLFIRLSMTQLFSDDFFQNFANRIYSILGVFMLFYLAYALLNALIDPDKLAKGEKSTSKIAVNLLVSLVILGFLPSVFDYAYRLQNYILSSNTIGALIFGGSTIDPNSGTEETMVKYGDAISFTVLNTFINPDNYNVEIDGNIYWDNVRADILENGSYGGITGLADPVVYGAKNVDSGNDVNVKYYVVLSSVVGVYLCYIMISFTLDLGVRVVKFAFCQLIAPIPVILRIIPGKKGTFDKWLKLTLSVYFEVFIRVAFMYLAIYFISALINNGVLYEQFFDSVQGMLALVIVILGIFTFAKQAPKMLGDMFGIDSGNLKLGIGEKLKAGGAFIGGAAIGAGVTGLVRNFIPGVGAVGKLGASAFNSFKAGHILEGFKNTGKTVAAGFGGAASSIAGATSGAFNAFKAGKDAKSFGDMAKAAGTGAQKSTENRINRANYKAAHGNTIKGAVFGHLQDTAFNVKEWAGVQFSTKDLQAQVSLFDKGTKFKSDLEDLALKKNDYVKALNGQLEALQNTLINEKDYYRTVTESVWNANTNTFENVERRVFDEQGYQAAIQQRSERISDLKNRKDIAVAKWVNDKLRDGDDNEVEAIKNAFSAYVRENAGVPEIANMKLESSDWLDSWQLTNADGTSKSAEEVKNILDQIKGKDANISGVSYLVNNSTLKDQKEKKTIELNERIIKEQEQKK